MEGARAHGKRGAEGARKAVHRKQVNGYQNSATGSAHVKSSFLLSSLHACAKTPGRKSYSKPKIEYGNVLYECIEPKPG